MENSEVKIKNMGNVLTVMLAVWTVFVLAFTVYALTRPAKDMGKALYSETSHAR
jgi:hypothetical protein